MMNQGANYDMLARQRMTNTQMQNNNTTMANIQVNKLRQEYPETILYRQTANDTQHRVPLKLSISPAPLFIKVTIPNMFPQMPPKIHMMSFVTHQHLDPVTIEYVGPAIRAWNPQTSSLFQVVKAVHDEFKQTPPLPKQMNVQGMMGASMMQRMQLSGAAGAGGAQQQQPQPNAVEFQEKQRYCGEQVPLEKPQLKELRQKVNQMSADQIQQYQAQEQERKSLYFEQPEVKVLKDTVKRLVGELKAQVDENCDEKNQLKAIWDQYDQKFATHQSLEQENSNLKQHVASLGGAASSNSTQNVVQLLNQRAGQADAEARTAEKAFLKGEQTDLKTFMDEYVSKRTDYHKYQLLKVKVGQQ